MPLSVNENAMPRGKTLGDVKADNLRTYQAEKEDREFQAKSDKHFERHHPGLLNGRNFLWNVMRWHGSLGERFDQTFKGCVGSDEWLDKQFCPICDKRRSLCKCKPPRKVGE